MPANFKLSWLPPPRSRRSCRAAAASRRSVPCYTLFRIDQLLFLIFFLFCLNGRLPEGSGYPITDFASRPGTEQTSSLGRVNPNTAAAGNQTQHLALHQASMSAQAD